MISVLMPVFNGEKFLKKSIRSVLESSFVHFEFIIINDGSSDSSHKIITGFTDNRIKYFRKENSGISDSLNFGLSKSKYELIARMDCDDLMMKDRLSFQYELIKKTNTDVLGSNAFIIDKNENFLEKTKIPIGHSSIKKKLESFESPMIHPSVMYKKSSVLKAGGYKELYADDYDLWLRMINKFSFMNTDKYLLKLRKHDTNLSKVKFEEFNNVKYNSIKNYYSVKESKINFMFITYKYFFAKNEYSSCNIFYKVLKEITKQMFILKLKLFK